MKHSVWCTQLSCSVCLHVWSTDGRAGDQALADLLVACYRGDCQVVQARLHENHELARQAVTTNQVERGYTALYVAACGGYAEIVRLLLEAGADVNSRSGTEARTPLMQVCLHTAVNGVKLPSDLVEVLSLSEQDTTEQKEASLQAVASCPPGCLHCLHLLLNSGADLDATDGQERCALYHCVARGHSEALFVLTEHGAKTVGWSSYKNDPLNAAAFKGHCACVRALLAAGCPILTATTDGYSALNDAAQKGHVEILECLLQHGALVDAKSSANGGAPLLAAALMGHVACMEALLAADADINRPASWGYTALYGAACKGQLAAVRYLVGQGAAVNCRGGDRDTPLLVACRNGHGAVVAALLKSGAF